MEHEGDSDTDCSGCTWNNPQMNGVGTGSLGNRKTSEDFSDNSIIKIAQNTEKSPLSLEKTWCLLNSIEKSPCEKLSKE